MSLSQLDPVVAQAEQQIEKQKLPPDKAVDYLLSKGVDPRLASLVMKYRMLKQSAAAAPGKAPPPKTVSQDIDDQINAQHAQRNAGVAALPVPDQMFNGQPQGMAGGGIVAFDSGGMTMPNDPTDLAAVQQQQFYQNLNDQQSQAVAQQIGQGMAGGGIVAFDEGGHTDYGSSYWDAVKDRVKELGGKIGDALKGQPPGPHHVGTGLAEGAAQQVSGRGKQIDDTVDDAVNHRHGGKIRHMDEGGETNEEDLQAQQAAIYARQLKDWQRQNAQSYLAKGQKLGVAPQQAQAKKGGLMHFDDGGWNQVGQQLGQIPQETKQLGSDIANFFSSPPSPAAGLSPQIQQEINEHITLGYPLKSPEAQSAYQQMTSPKGGAPAGAKPPAQNAPAQGGAPAQGQPPAPPAAPNPLAGPMRSFGPGQNVQPPPMNQSASMSASARTGGGQQVPLATNGVPLAEQQKMDEDKAALAKQVPLSISEYYNQLSDIAEKQGIGAAAKEHLAQLDQLQSQFSEYKRQGNWLALSKAGFAMAQAATQNPHGGFLGALAVGGQAGGEAYSKNIEEYRQASMKLQEQKYVVKQTQENLLNDRTKEALDEHNKALAHYDSYAARVDASQNAALARVTSAQIAAEARNAQIKAAQISRANAYSMDPQVYRDLVDKGVSPLEAARQVRGTYANVQAKEEGSNNAQILEARKVLMSDPMFARAVAKGDTDTVARMTNNFLSINNKPSAPAMPAGFDPNLFQVSKVQ
jgi:hypothetical protein